MEVVKPENSIEVTVSDVSITNVGFAIFLKPISNKNGMVVPIFIGPLETYSISSALDGIKPPRPNTHDLLVNIIQEMEASISHIVINDIIGSVFYARIVVKTVDGIIEVDARPSDTVALAIRTKCPMYMNEKVYNEASVMMKPNKDEGDDYEKDDSFDKQIIENNPDLNYTKSDDLEKLKKDLQKAVELENFEQAANLRDQIRKLTQEN